MVSSSQIARLCLQSPHKSFYISALAATVCVVAYGAFVSLGSSNARFAADQRVYGNEYILKDADGHQALFKTNDGFSLVTVGSPLAGAGYVESIEQQDGRWKVTTSKHLSFVQN